MCSRRVAGRCWIKCRAVRRLRQRRRRKWRRLRPVEWGKALGTGEVWFDERLNVAYVFEDEESGVVFPADPGDLCGGGHWSFWHLRNCFLYGEPGGAPCAGADIYPVGE